jgi:hypothetical protein
MSSEEAPLRPPRWQEAVATWLLSALAPSVERRPSPPPPEALAPFETFSWPRRNRPGQLAATFFPAEGEARGIVLLAHPWIKVGQAYFHRQGRLEALRRAGLAALTFDFGGLGSSERAPGLFDLDLEDAFRALEERAGNLPRYFWGVSAGGHWSHPVLARRDGVEAAMFEDVSPHLLEWSWNMAPHGRPAYLFFRHALPKTYRYMDMRHHAPHLRVQRVTYVGGALDRGVPPESTRELAERAGGKCLIVPDANHLAAIKRDPEAVISLALETFGVG